MAQYGVPAGGHLAERPPAAISIAGTQRQSFSSQVRQRRLGLVRVSGSIRGVLPSRLQTALMHLLQTASRVLAEPLPLIV